MLKKQNCIICFEKRTCPPLSYGCCHFDICFICLEKWNDVNHGIERCPVCREIQYEKPVKFLCFSCKRLSAQHKLILIQILVGQLIFVFIVFLFK